MPKSIKKIPARMTRVSVSGRYLDYASSVSPNPSSIHDAGVKAKKILEEARAKTARTLSARPEEIIFTSGGTESNNLAIQGLIHLSPAPLLIKERGKGVRFPPHIITTNIEHSSVLLTCKMLEKRKLAEISIISVEKNGIVDPKKIRKAIKPNTVLVSVMYANNEIGTIQPIKEIAKEIRHYNKKYPHPTSPYSRGRIKEGVIFHTDAVQAANYLNLNVEELGVDLLSLSGSKISDAGRVGALYKRKSVKLAPLWGGGNQEFGLRPGTENLPAIIKFEEALKCAQKIKEKETKRLQKIRNYFISKLFHSNILKNVGMIFNGDLEKRLPNNVNITVPKIESDLLVLELSARGIMASAKSACKEGDGKASHVIKAINPHISERDGSIRFSLGRSTTKKEIDFTVKALSDILKKLEKWYTR